MLRHMYNGGFNMQSLIRSGCFARTISQNAQEALIKIRELSIVRIYVISSATLIFLTFQLNTEWKHGHLFYQLKTGAKIFPFSHFESDFYRS